MDKRLYNIVHCPFCGDELDNDMEDEVEYDEEEYDQLQKLWARITLWSNVSKSFRCCR